MTHGSAVGEHVREPWSAFAGAEGVRANGVRRIPAVESDLTVHEETLEYGKRAVEADS